MSYEIDRLHAAIRAHRDARGDDRCWMDDEALYAVLPEGFTPASRDSAVEIENCRRFIANRQHPATEYVSPEREIERLRAEVARLKGDSHDDKKENEKEKRTLWDYLKYF